jgi:hypothetical protein
MTRSRFVVNSINNFQNGTSILELKMSNNADNNIFSALPPIGTIEMYITNSSTLSEFTLGSEYYVDFTSVSGGGGGGGSN